MDRQDIIDQIYDMRSEMKRGMQRYMQAAQQQLPVSRAQIELLFTLKHDQPTHSKQLAEAVGTSPGAVSQLLDGLFEKDYVARTTDPNDRRLQLLRLTKKGDKLVAGLHKQREQVMERIIHKLDDEELVIWLNVQKKIIAEFNTQSDQQKGSK